MTGMSLPVMGWQESLPYMYPDILEADSDVLNEDLIAKREKSNYINDFFPAFRISYSPNMSIVPLNIQARCQAVVSSPPVRLESMILVVMIYKV